MKKAKLDRVLIAAPTNHKNGDDMEKKSIKIDWAYLRPG
jgi:hypothetical protein